MSEERIQNITSPQPEEQEIDLIELAQKVFFAWLMRDLAWLISRRFAFTLRITML